MNSSIDNGRIQPLVLTVPGLDNSGAGHWQSIWERERADCQRADLGMWSNPHRNSWVTMLNSAIRQADCPVILAAHSLGCLAVAWWAALETQSYGNPVAGALLVAPPDVDAAGPDPRLAGFGPAPKVILPFPSVTIASSNDPYIDLARARSLAKFWGSHFVEIGDAGHVNAESGLGDWQEGQQWLDRLLGLATGDDVRSEILGKSIFSSSLKGIRPISIDS
ncbi:alpha/beta hydrolase [Sphingobium sufflavum]|uniref:RBBP9/YdeN family alpha/beta hydrolase n=1 Tax=Sphingobium sufflavum TaxID=1129547 RepID=UPI001F3BC905|nr:alpha/beta hydrolase [Sphingobium sufflavum]MCE7795606.1 alpha/beta hydrolase [Sphingobium sufflavum]